MSRVTSIFAVIALSVAMKGWLALPLAVVGLLAASPAQAETPAPPRHDAGAPCAGGYECVSGHCADGVCCQRACTSRCEQCNLPGQEGTCLPAVAGTDPRVECPGSGPCRATCDGLGRCAFPGEDLACAAAACVAGTTSVNRGSTCNGMGACVDRGTQDCAPFVCRAGACATTCASEGDCALGATCLGTSCGESRPRGAPCVTAAECASGHCAHDVCCDRECTGACERCDQPDGTGRVEGTCRVLEGQSPAGACPGQGFCRGICSVDGTCSWPDASIYCNVCLACDGAGSCNQLPATRDDDRCGSYGCPVVGCTALRAGPRCVAAGRCADPGSTEICTVQTTVPDGHSCLDPSPPSGYGMCQAGACVVSPPDGGARDGSPDAHHDALGDRDERRYAYCGCGVEGRPAVGLALLALAVLSLAGRKRDGVSR